MAKILIVEDDPQIGQMVVYWLNQEGYTTELMTTGPDGLQLLRSFNFDLIILDWELPGMSGYEVMEKFRQDGGNTPIIFLTGRTDIDSKATSLDGGADDYMTKPCDPRELAARVRSMLRRPAGLLPSRITVGNVVLEPETKRVFVNNEAARLTTKEYAVLEHLMRHPNRIFSTKELLSSIWPSTTESAEDTVRTCVKTLRRKLMPPEGTDCVVKTVTGAGYMIQTEK